MFVEFHRFSLVIDLESSIFVSFHRTSLMPIDSGSGIIDFHRISLIFMYLHRKHVISIDFHRFSWILGYKVWQPVATCGNIVMPLLSKIPWSDPRVLDAWMLGCLDAWMLAGLLAGLLACWGLKLKL